MNLVVSVDVLDDFNTVASVKRTKEQENYKSNVCNIVSQQ